MIKTTRFLPALLLQSPLPLMWTSEWTIAWTYHTDKTQSIKSTMSQRSWRPHRYWIHTQQPIILSSRSHSLLFCVIKIVLSWDAFSLLPLSEPFWKPPPPEHLLWLRGTKIRLPNTFLTPMHLKQTLPKYQQLEFQFWIHHLPTAWPYANFRPM